MSVQTAMTAIADKIRAILGVSGAMGLDAMATNLGTVQTDIDGAYTAVGNQGGTVPSSRVSGNLASAISTIPTGVTVQRKSGTFTTNTSGVATVNVGFQPDIVFIQGETITEDGSVYDHSMAMVFTEDGRSNIKNTTMWYMDGIIDVTWTRATSQFTVTIRLFSWDLTESVAINKTYSYVAIKYT